MKSKHHPTSLAKRVYVCPFFIFQHLKFRSALALTIPDPNPAEASAAWQLEASSVNSAASINLFSISPPVSPWLAGKMPKTVFWQQLNANKP